MSPSPTLPAAPDWLLARLAPPDSAQQLPLDPPAATSSPSAAPSAPADRRLRGWAVAGMKREIDALAATQEGQRGSTLNAVAYRLYRLEAAGLLTENEIDVFLVDACQVNGLIAKDGLKKIEAIRDAGKKKGRAAGPPALPTFDEPAGGGNGKLTTPPQPAQPDSELEKLRRFACDARRVLTTAWKPAAKLTALYVELRKLDGEEQLGSVTAREVSKDIKISPATANNSIKQLSLAGLLERRVDNVLMDSQRREVDPRQVDPRSAQYHWESQSTLIAPALPQELPEELPTTIYDKSQREASAENLRKLRWAAVQLRQLECPCCGEVGHMRAVCVACGAPVDPESATDI